MSKRSLIATCLGFSLLALTACSYTGEEAPTPIANPAPPGANPSDLEATVQENFPQASKVWIDRLGKEPNAEVSIVLRWAEGEFTADDLSKLKTIGCDAVVNTESLGFTVYSMPAKEVVSLEPLWETAFPDLPYEEKENGIRVSVADVCD